MPHSRLRFDLVAEAPGTRARAGVLHTLHGEVPTPVFMPVGTQATVRSQTLETVRESGSKMLLANTYHLLLRPGPEVFERFGGIHRFMGWDGGILTDSGGYQIFCLPHSRKITEDGAEFRSYVDGSKIQLTPERSIGMQRSIGSDIMMALDVCVPSACDRAEAKEAMDRTHRWAARSLRARGDSKQALFGIVQGALFEDLRAESAAALSALGDAGGFDGFAIGGLAVGEGRGPREDITEATAQLLPRDRPRYLMGVGTPIDLLEAVHRGVDMFDCILPIAESQHGKAFTSQGWINLRRGAYRMSEEALDPNCPCPVCARHPRAYLHHLIKTREILGWHLLGAHNLYFYHSMMASIRASIIDGTFSDLYHRLKPILERDEDADYPTVAPKRSRVRTRAPLRELGDYEVIDGPSGHAMVRQRSTGERMHAVSEPIREANALYVEQSGLRERLSGVSVTGGSATGAASLGDECVVWDVGLGAATNAMAAVACARALGEGRRPLRIVSFERDLDPMRLALANYARFPYLDHPAPRALLKTGLWEGEGIRWELRTGDFLETLADAAVPELVYFDPFSFKSDAPLWSVDCFKKILEKTRDRPAASPAALYTYSASTLVRARMLAAGFHVGPGMATPPKAETTIAYAGYPAGASLLGAEWLGRWDRSEVRGTPEASGLDVAVRGHPQFAR